MRALFVAFVITIAACGSRAGSASRPQNEDGGSGGAAVGGSGGAAGCGVVGCSPIVLGGGSPENDGEGCWCQINCGDQEVAQIQCIKPSGPDYCECLRRGEAPFKRWEPGITAGPVSADC